MDIVKQKETRLSSTFQERKYIEIPVNFSREKALTYISNRSDGGNVYPKPERPATDSLYEMYLKIGALNELPSDKDQISSFLSELWVALFYENHLVPQDIPGDIVVSEFTKAFVSGRAPRRGNNMAAIVTAFNDWIVSSGVRDRLYETRNKYYPQKKPKELPRQTTPIDETDHERMISGEKVENWPDETIVDQHKKINQVMGNESFDQWMSGLNGKGYIKRIFNEAERRGLVTQSKKS